MKFETGKFYKTRSGRKAQIFMLSNGDSRMLGAVLRDSWLSMNWNQQGIYIDRSKYMWDLVSEWKEPIKYSVELWGGTFAPRKDAVNIEGFVFGTKGEWSDEPTEICPTKYRVTVEEIGGTAEESPEETYDE